MTLFNYQQEIEGNNGVNCGYLEGSHFTQQKIKIPRAFLGSSQCDDLWWGEEPHCAFLNALGALFGRNHLTCFVFRKHVTLS